ncbi:MAG: hypothetical protein MI757_14505 [Pirellulales bacterium]|nr:hypothetical protein [Pirellulales bacterium]
MAARESQGMQIALIIFAITTVALGVTTYLFFDKWEQEKTKQAQLVEDKQKALDAAAAVKKDLADLKKIVTINTGASVADLVAEHQTIHRDLYPIDRNEKELTYPQLLEQLEVTKRALAGDYDSTRSQVIALEKKIQEIELAKAGQVTVFKTRFDANSQRLAGIEDKYAVATTKLTQNTNAAIAALEREKLKLTEHERNIARKVDDQNKEIRERDKRINVLEQKVEQGRPDLDEVKIADGRVSLVSTEKKTAYISLGSADGLRPRVRFLVIPNNDEAIGEAQPKATLEVTQILEGHRSIVRILDAELLDPVLAGDRIYSETWKKGQRTGFALAGWMDINGDGRSDRRKVAAIISQNGGRIDAQVDDDGKISGKMTIDTDYLIKGDYPRPPHGGKAAQLGFDKFVATAEKNNSRQLDFRQYLQNLGYTVTNDEGEKENFRTRRPIPRRGAYQ